MATIQTYTDLEQSKKLAEILPLESADMVIWGKDLDSIAATDAQKFMSGLKDRKMNYLPCWSLTALLKVMPFWYDIHPVKNGVAIKCDYGKQEIVISSNHIDACVEMIIKLNKLNLL